MIYLKTFKLSNHKISDDNIYPYSILKNKEPDIFIFDNRRSKTVFKICVCTG